jgi:predicted ribosome quality control (RQC) complex YloA/Tae2 family protein
MLDAFFVTALVAELSERLTGARIDKVYMPERDEVVLALRTPKYGNVRLLLGVGNAPRVHLTASPRENPPTPPMFCMFLRKYLTGARISAVTQPPLERIVRLQLDTVDELGVPSQKTLVAELLARRANLIVVDAEGRVQDGLKRADGDTARPVLPGLFYRPPPGSDKPSALDVTPAEFAELYRAKPPERPEDQWLLDTFWGLSPLLCRELAHRAEGRSLQEVYFAFLEEVRQGRFTPVLLLDGDSPADFSFLLLGQYGSRRRCEVMGSFSELLDAYYGRRERDERARKRASALRKTLLTARERVTRKTAAQFSEWKAAQDKERLRQLGDLLTANLHRIERGAEAVRLPDFYDPEQRETEIRLDPRKSPQQNAQKYYKDYNRMKNAEVLLAEQLRQGERERAYLDSVLEALDRAESAQDLQELRDELAQGGYVSPQSGKRAVKPKPSQPLGFVSSAGVAFYAGRNNRQNDQLTLKLSDKNDLWLHAQKIPGAHVVIPGGHPDEQTLQEAAAVAATLSQAKNSPKVPVDYTQVRYVKKPAGLKPGMVLYDRFKTILAEPDPRLAERLKQP